MKSTAEPKRLSSGTRRRVTRDSGTRDSVTRRGSFRWVGLIGAVALLTAGVNTACAIDVDQVIWGFDGRATRDCFNPVSILVSNPTSEPFSGTLELRRMVGPVARVGAILVEEVYLSPNSSRWVQFYPYTKEDSDEWRLRWGRRGTEQSEIPKPRLGEQTPVLFSDLDDPAQRGGSLKRFPEHLFPPMVTATDALTSVALDHVPRWESARRQAFLDWLSRGGRLHLFEDTDGKLPQFSAELAPLNLVQERYRVGSGFVYRHRRPLAVARHKNAIAAMAEAEQGDLTAKVEQKPESKERSPAGRIVVANSGDEAANAKARAWMDEQLRRDFTGQVLRFLKSMVIPEHDWMLIYATGVVYMLALFPGLYWLGRRRVDYRLVYGSLIGLIVVFSLGFSAVGRRGQGEATCVDSFGVARQLPEGALDVTLWSNFFVVKGDAYAITRQASGQLFSTAQSVEEVRGVIRNGANGRFDVEIPVFSSRPVVQRLKVKEPRFEVSLREFSQDRGTLSKLRLEIQGNAPQRDKLAWACAVYRDAVYPLVWTDQGLMLQVGGREPLNTFLARAAIRIISPQPRWMSGGPVEERFNFDVLNDPRLDPIYRALLDWSLNRGDVAQGVKTRVVNQLQLYLVGEMPESLQVLGTQFRAQKGRLLYEIEISIPEKP